MNNFGVICAYEIVVYIKEVAHDGHTLGFVSFDVKSHLKITPGVKNDMNW